MTSSLSVTRVLDARLHGVAPVALYLHYDVADPAAVGIGLSTCHACELWYVARQVLAAALVWDGICDCAAVAAAGVTVSRPPGHDYVLMVLVHQRRRLPLAVAAGQLAGFLDLSHALCSPQREQLLIDAELGAQIRLFQAANGQEDA